MSNQVRSEHPVLEQETPTPPEFYSSPSPRLEQVPRNSSRLPQLPAPQLIPPPAPPTEAARWQPVPAQDADFDPWAHEPVELVNEADSELFATEAAAYPPAFVTERSENYAAQLKAAGLAARKRKEIREPLWPVIVPGPSMTTPVVTQAPELMPVPK